MLRSVVHRLFRAVLRFVLVRVAAVFSLGRACTVVSTVVHWLFCSQLCVSLDRRCQSFSSFGPLAWASMLDLRLGVEVCSYGNSLVWFR